VGVLCYELLTLISQQPSPQVGCTLQQRTQSAVSGREEATERKLRRLGTQQGAFQSPTALTKFSSFPDGPLPVLLPVFENHVENGSGLRIRAEHKLSCCTDDVGLMQAQASVGSSQVHAPQASTSMDMLTVHLHYPSSS